MSKIAKKYILSYPDSLRLTQEEAKKHDAIRKMLDSAITGSKEQLMRAVNKCVYDNAEKLGVSIYDLCFHTIPECEIEGLLTTIRLTPVEFDLTHDGGYWKEKCYALKKKMQEVIDSKDGSHE